MNYFTKDTSNKYEQPIFIEYHNPEIKSSKKSKTKTEIYFMSKYDKPPEVKDCNNSNISSRIIKKMGPPKGNNLEQLVEYETCLDKYMLDNNFKVVADKDSVLMPIPMVEGRQIIVIAAPSGAGKSTFCNQYIKLFHKLHPDRPIYVISHLDEDKSLDNGLEDIIQRLTIDEEMVDDYLCNGGFDISEFKDSCILCDDYDSINNKKIRSFIEHIIDCCMKIGRHENINILITSHLLYSSGGAKHNRIVLSEANAFVLFPSRTTKKPLTYLCNTYIGLENSKINEMRNWSDRYVFINKCVPCYIIGQNHAEIIT